MYIYIFFFGKKKSGKKKFLKGLKKNGGGGPKKEAQHSTVQYSSTVPGSQLGCSLRSARSTSRNRCGKKEGFASTTFERFSKASVPDGDTIPVVRHQPGTAPPEGRNYPPLPGRD